MPPNTGPIHVVPKHHTSHPSEVRDVKSAADLGRAVAYHRHQAKQIAQSQVRDTKSNHELRRGVRQVDHEHKQLVNLAKRVLAIHRHSEINPTHDTKGALELLTADAFKLTPQYEHDFTQSALAGAEYQRAQDEAAQKKEEGKYKGSIPKLGLGLITGHGPILHEANLAANAASSVARDIVHLNPLTGVTNPVHALASRIPGLSSIESQVQKHAETIVGSAAREAIDIPANAIPSTYYLASPLAHGDVKEVGKRFVSGLPHNLSQVEHHPLSTALILSGAGRGLSRAAGRAERTIRGPHEAIVRKLPGTAAKELILPNKGLIGYRMQIQRELRKAERQGGHVRMSDTAVRFRVDQHFYQEQLLSRQAAQDSYKAAKDQGMTEESAKAASLEVHKMTARYYRDSAFLDVALRHKSGAGAVRTFDKEEKAQAFADSWRQKMFNMGRTDIPAFDAVKLNEALGKGSYVVIPHSAKHQFQQHDSYMTPTVMSAVGSTVTGAFRRTVLPFSVKWFNANIVEGALRDVISGGALPTSVAKGMEFRSFLKEINPEYYAKWKTVVAGGGHGQMQRNLLVEQDVNTFENRTAETKLAGFGKAMTQWGKRPTVQTAAHAFDKYTDVVFHTLNGSWERAVHMGMAGKVLRDHPLMDNALRNAAQKALTEVERGGVSDSEFMNVMVPFAKELHGMFGKYGAFSPSTRRSIATWTPFIAWTLNSINFVTHYLPKDHPIVTALLADANKSSLEWRKNKGLAYFMKGAVPFWLMGSIPVGSSKWRGSQMTPFGLWGDPTMTVSGTFNPLGQAVWQNLQGKDWKGADLKGSAKSNPYYKTGLALLTFIEGTVPITGIAAQMSQGKSLSQIENPYRPVAPPKDKTNKSFYEQTPASGSKSYYEPSSKKSSGSYYEP